MGTSAKMGYYFLISEIMATFIENLAMTRCPHKNLICINSFNLSNDSTGWCHYYFHLRTRVLKHRKIKHLAQGHTAVRFKDRT